MRGRFMPGEGCCTIIHVTDFVSVQEKPYITSVWKLGDEFFQRFMQRETAILGLKSARAVC
jgi:hypothetical protein